MAVLIPMRREAVGAMRRGEVGIATLVLVAGLATACGEATSDPSWTDTSCAVSFSINGSDETVTAVTRGSGAREACQEMLQTDTPPQADAVPTTKAPPICTFTKFGHEWDTYGPYQPANGICIAARLSDKLPTPFFSRPAGG